MATRRDRLNGAPVQAVVMKVREASAGNGRVPGSSRSSPYHLTGETTRSWYTGVGRVVTVTSGPRRGDRLKLGGELVTVEVADERDAGVQLIVRRSDGTTGDEYAVVGPEGLGAVEVSDGQPNRYWLTITQTLRMYFAASRSQVSGDDS